MAQQGSRYDFGFEKEGDALASVKAKSQAWLLQQKG
jgi:hypothetical protein